MAHQSLTPKIAIVDYGMGNLSSVAKAFQYLKTKAIITSSPTVIARAEKIVLPGVGAFGDAMEEMGRRKLKLSIQNHILKGKKFLGICLGLQLLFEKSEESRGVSGLSILPGKVQRFRTKKAKVPQMGWNQLFKIQNHPVLKNITSKDFFYFVHSYYAASRPENTFAMSEHGGEKFTAIAGNAHAIAVQFHPEKSQEPGLRLLKNFISW